MLLHLNEHVNLLGTTPCRIRFTRHKLLVVSFVFIIYFYVVVVIGVVAVLARAKNTIFNSSSSSLDLSEL